MKSFVRRFGPPLVALVLVLGVGFAAMTSGKHSQVGSNSRRTAAPRASGGPYLSAIPNPEVDMTWTDAAYGGTDGTTFVNSIRTTRTAVRSGGTLTGCTLSILYTASSASELNRIRLVYTPASGPDVVLDDASQANARISSSDTSVTVSGTVPVTAIAVKLLWTRDGGTEAIVDDWRFQ